MTPLLLPRLARRYLAAFLNKLTRGAARQAAPCPQCGEKLRLPKMGVDTLWDTRVECGSCGRVSSMLSAVGAREGSRTPERLEAVEVDTDEGASMPRFRKPPESRIIEAEQGGQKMWKVPAKGGCNFMLFFAAFWLLITGAVSAAALLGNVDSELSGWALALFLSVFWAIGLLVGWFGLHISRAEHWILITADQIVHQKHLLWMGRRRSYPRSGLRTVRLMEFYSQNYEPVHGIEIRTRKGRIRFGSALEDEEKKWLCRELQLALEVSEEGLGEDEGEAQDPVAPEGSARWEVEESLGQLRLKSKPGKGARITALVCFAALMVPGFMMIAGPPLPDSDTPLAFSLFQWGFAILWYGGLAVPALALASVGWLAWRASRAVWHWQADRSGVTVQILTGRQVWKEQHWRRDEIAGVEVCHVSSTRTNRRPWTRDHRLELVGPDRVCGLGWGEPVEELERVASRLRELLRLPGD